MEPSHQLLPLLSLFAVALCVLLAPVLSAEGEPACASGEAEGEDSGFCAMPQSSPPAADTGKTLVLYGNPLSSCTRRVLLTLVEKDLLDFKFEVLNLQRGDQKQPEYMEIQPFGKVPALKDGDLTIFESRAIIRYLAEKYNSQGTPLFGSNIKEKAAVNVWLEVESNEFQQHAAVINYEMIVGQRYGKKPNKTRAQEAADKLADVLDVYEERLESNKYLAGDFVSLADLSHMPLTAALWAAGFNDLIDNRENLSRWWKDVTARKSWLRLVEGIP